MGSSSRVSPWKIGLGVLAAGAGLALGTYGYAYLATHPRRRRIRKTPAMYGLSYESVAFAAGDGLLISGWLIPARDPKGVVIVCHGYPNNRTEMLPHALFLHRAGYATLLFDFRAMGESEGEISSAGQFEVEDLRGALDYLETRPDVCDLPVGVLGLSLGGAVAILTAAQDERIQALVADAAYSDLRRALQARWRLVLGPLAPLATHPVEWWARRWFPLRPREIAPCRVIRSIGPRAVMLIQGQRDLLVRWQDAVAMFAEAREPRELWLVRNSHHSRCLSDSPAEYARRVAAFFDAHLKG